jgi:hypothetical protein
MVQRLPGGRKFGHRRTGSSQILMMVPGGEQFIELGG